MTGPTSILLDQIRSGSGPDVNSAIKEYLEESPDNQLTPYLIKVLLSSSEKAIRPWIFSWLKKHQSPRATLALLETDPDQNVIDFAKQLVRKDPPHPFLGWIVESLTRLAPGPDTLLLARQWLDSFGEVEPRKLVLRYVLQQPQFLAIDSQRYLDAKIADGENYGLLLALIKHHPTSVVLRAAKNFLRLHEGTTNSAFILSALLETKRLRNPSKWVDHWFSHHRRNVRELQHMVIESYLRSTRPSTHAARLAIAHPGLLVIETMLQWDKNRRIREWIREFIHFNIKYESMDLYLERLLGYSPDPRTVSLSKEWLNRHPLRVRTHLLRALFRRGIFDHELSQMTDEFLKDFPDEEDAAYLAVEACKFRPDYFVPWLRDWMSKHPDESNAYRWATVAILEQMPDKELLQRVQEWLREFELFHRLDHSYNAHWESEFHLVMLIHCPDDDRISRARAWLRDYAKFEPSRARRLKQRLSELHTQVEQ